MTSPEAEEPDQETAELVAAFEREEPRARNRLLDWADAAPDLLAPFLPRLLAVNALYPSLYQEADEETQRAMVARIESGAEKTDDLDNLMTALAQARGPVSDAAFLRWQEHPPPGAEHLPLAPAELLPQGGRTLEDGRIRELCGPDAFQLAPEDVDAPEDGKAEEGCPRCGAPPWHALDLDMSDPKVASALSHTGWRGRLRITARYCCMSNDDAFFAVGPDGSCAPLGQDGASKDDPFEVPTVRLVPSEEEACDRPGLQSAIGGQPEWGHDHWWRDAEYPECPACGRLMDYVAQIYLGDLWDDDLLEGFYFFFLHAGCERAAIVTQG